MEKIKIEVIIPKEREFIRVFGKKVATKDLIAWYFGQDNVDWELMAEHYLQEQSERTEDWAGAIAKRVSDEWSGKKDSPVDAKLLEDVLTKALKEVPDLISRLIGTSIIEENYFEKL